MFHVEQLNFCRKVTQLHLELKENGSALIVNRECSTWNKVHA